MNSEILELSPKAFWGHFLSISAIPRCSRHEDKIIDFLKSQAAVWGLETRQDSVGNLCIRKPASPGREKKPTVVLQGHVDMVCEQNAGRGHDFSRDPLVLLRDGEWVRADRTTLGADNGVAVAYMLSVLEDKTLLHGPVECLFTVDEETGLTGALGLDPSLVDGKILINLDSDVPGEFITGCAGGSTTHGELTVSADAEPSESTDREFYRVFFHGWKGGHSGVTIHEGRGNPLKDIGRFWDELEGLDPGLDWRLFHCEGGDKHNAIPREAVLGLAGPRGREVLLSDLAEKLSRTVRDELGPMGTEVAVEVGIWKESPPSRVLTAEASRSVGSLLCALPHGVHSFSRLVPGLVETSNNLAAVKLEHGTFRIVTSQRSSRASQRDDLSRRIRSVLQLSGAKVKQADGYPAWTPSEISRLRELCVRLWPETGGGEAKVTVIHAGLECGILGDKIPGLDMISFGPAIEEAHTPNERLMIDSVGRVWNFLLALLEAI